MRTIGADGCVFAHYRCFYVRTELVGKNVLSQSGMGLVSIHNMDPVREAYLETLKQPALR